MTMRICSAKIIPALWFSLCALGAMVWAAEVSSAIASTPAKSAKKAAPRKKAPPVASGPVTLAGLVRAYRQAPTPARRSAVTAYAAAHPKEAPLANLALGVAAYEQKDFPNAIASLQKLNGKLPQIADYAAYYSAAARVENNDGAGAVRDLLPLRSTEVTSPLTARSRVVEARALKLTQPSDAVRVLRDHYGELPQPDGDLTLGECDQAAGDLRGAAEAYQRVYYQYPLGDAATRAAAALLALKDAMADRYPQPPPRLLLRRPDRLLELRDLSHARSEYQALLDRPPSLERDQARVRIGAVDYVAGRISVAIPYLVSLDVGESEADAERLYYLEECQRRQGDDQEIAAILKHLAEKYPNSPWRLKALMSAGNRYLLVNRPEDYVPLYQEAYRKFASEPAAATAHWKVTFSAWMHNHGDTAALLREQVTRYPTHATAGAALYFLGRDAEQHREFGDARAYYDRLCKTFENHYYALLARERLQRVEIQAVAPSARAQQFLSTLALPIAKPIGPDATPATAARIERSRLLRGAGLGDLADSELRFGARTDGQPGLLGMEMASAAEAPNHAMRIMKGMSPEYMELPLESSPRKYWELLFPLPYRGELTADAAERGIDPYLLAGLIRQESEFDPGALSPARAYGLTQVRPGTGRQFARSAGISRFSAGMLYEPAVNLKIGSSILRSMLDQNGGHLEQTLASYNAGPARVSEWLTWNNYREPAEFVESIPFTETRDYVQAVLRNADIYRRLYQ
ncbi:MAG: lytic transglycosylase domain-containing protein [Candidatus Sulfopaludibacter sp.]|nr:lytic transglycosylase domain-containing protein [Candidatus Sulfopaludibacter sp.]